MPSKETKKLSKGILELKFMKRSKEKIEREADEDERHQLYDEQLATVESGAERVIIVQSHFDCHEYLPCRMSFGGFDPDIEKMNLKKLKGVYKILRVTAEAENAEGGMTTDVTAEEFSSRMNVKDEFGDDMPQIGGGGGGEMHRNSKVNRFEPRGNRGSSRGDRGSRGGRGGPRGDRGSPRGDRGSLRGDRGSLRGDRGSIRGDRGSHGGRGCPRGSRGDFRGRRGSFRGNRGNFNSDGNSKGYEEGEFNSEINHSQNESQTMSEDSIDRKGFKRKSGQFQEEDVRENASRKFLKPPS